MSDAGSGLPRPEGTLAPLWWGAISAGVLSVPVALALFGAIPDLEVFPAIMALAIGGFVFSGLFFLGANLMGVRFEARVRDETRVSGANVDHITHVEETGDAGTDRWLSRYVFARTLFGSLIVPLAILLGLFWFA